MRVARGQRSLGDVSPTRELSGIENMTELNIVRYVCSVHGNPTGQALQSKLLVVDGLLPAIIRSRRGPIAMDCQRTLSSTLLA